MCGQEYQSHQGYKNTKLAFHKEHVKYGLYILTFGFSHLEKQ